MTDVNNRDKLIARTGEYHVTIKVAGDSVEAKEHAAKAHKRFDHKGKGTGPVVSVGGGSNSLYIAGTLVEIAGQTVEIGP